MKTQTMLHRLLQIGLIPAAVLFSCSGKSGKNEDGNRGETPAVQFEVRTTWPHHEAAFTQGLVIHKGVLYEGTGGKGSWIGVIDVKTGEPDKKVILDDKYFGEGITILNNKLYQLTWKSNIGFVYKLDTFEKIHEFPYEGEGWGLTHNGTHLIMSNGTDKLTFLDTATLKPVRVLRVVDEKGPVNLLNELEYAEGYIYANVWMTNRIVKIDPQTGKVAGRLDLSALERNAKLRNPNADVLNGIAYHASTGLFVITGKNWPSYYILRLQPDQQKNSR